MRQMSSKLGEMGYVNFGIKALEGMFFDSR